MNKTSQLEPYRLAKKWKGGDNIEKQVLLAICDTCSLRDLECRKKPSTIVAQYGISRSKFKRGLQGRKRPDGSEYYPGLLARGFVRIKRGGTLHAGAATVYVVDLDVLRGAVEEANEDVSKGVSRDGSKDVSKDVSNRNSEMSPSDGGTCLQNAVEMSPNELGDVSSGDIQQVPNEVPKVPNAGTKERETENSTHSLPQSASPDSPRSARGSAESTATPNGQEKARRVVNDTVVRAKKVNGKVRFTPKSLEQLLALAPKLSGANTADLDVAIRQAVDACGDERAFSMFGSTFAANVLTDIAVAKEKRETAQRESVRRQHPSKGRCRECGGSAGGEVPFETYHWTEDLCHECWAENAAGAA